MILLQERTWFTSNSTISTISVDGVFQCYILEDVCREHSPGTWGKELKILGKTAIPYGRYRVIVDLSQRFKMMLPLLLNVPDFAGIRIHPGNKAEDTEGCLLPGLTRDTDIVMNSRAAFGPLFRKIDGAIHIGEPVWIDIVKQEAA